jgi:hypothetical protein
VTLPKPMTSGAKASGRFACTVPTGACQFCPSTTARDPPSQVCLRNRASSDPLVRVDRPR